MVEFIRDVVVVLALLMSLFALAYHTPGEHENVRNASANGPLVHSGKISAPSATSVSASK